MVATDSEAIEDVELEVGEAQDGRGIKSGIKQFGEGAIERNSCLDD